MSEKTEEPTPKRLRKAREEGDSGQSAALSQGVAFLVCVSLVPGAARVLASRSADALRAAIARAESTSATAAFDAAQIASDVVMLSVPVLLGAFVAGAATSLVQTGGFVASKKLVPNLERLNVFQGFGRLFTAARLFGVARSLALASLVAYLAYRGLRAHMVDLARLAGRLGWAGPAAGAIAGDLARGAALFGLALGVVDAVVTQRGFRKKLRMSKEEVKREHKESEGDPETKAARERARHEMLAAAAVANVRTASVVVVNPTHLACALRYDEKEGDEAPVVVASGEGELAERIVRAARDYGVPILQDVPLARALAELQIGDAIPEALYEAVAEILREAWNDEGT